MPRVHTVTLTHGFEAAHRLPHIGGRCKNLHGHSWKASIAIAAPALSLDYTVIEFGSFKAVMRRWIDLNLDHAAMLGAADTLLPPLRADGSKVYVFGEDWTGAEWPTVEAVAAMLADQAQGWIRADDEAAPGCRVARVTVQETATNTAEYEPPVDISTPGVGRLWHKSALRESA